MMVLLNCETNWIETGGVRRPMTLDEFVDLLCENCHSNYGMVELSFEYGPNENECFFLCEECVAEIIKGRLKINRAYIEGRLDDETLEMYVGKMNIAVI